MPFASGPAAGADVSGAGVAGAGVWAKPMPEPNKRRIAETPMVCESFICRPLTMKASANNDAGANLAVRGGFFKAQIGTSRAGSNDRTDRVRGSVQVRN